MDPVHLASPDAFEAFLAAFEAGTLPKTAWTHGAHVAMGAAYNIRYGECALARIRDAIRRFNLATGGENTDTSGYHETLTVFWTELLGREVSGFTGPWQAACHAVAKYGSQRGYHQQFYSFDVVASTEARRRWIPPDRDPASASNPDGR
ncbi:MAG: hypothetical protein FJW40_10155 [Acidobacteria bacterium]|nr:hypothetical protein [Acidobacteriota bacterium]